MAAEMEPLNVKDKYADQLSAGTYTWKKLKEIVISAGGIVGGWQAGKLFNKLRKTPAPEFIIPLGKNGIKGTPAKVVGALVGSAIAGMILAYEHWVKQESNKLAIDEINNDVSHMIIHQRTDPELVKENDRLRAMLEEETPQSERAAKHKRPASHSERLEEKDASPRTQER